jgi:hypothetical protein
MNGGTDSLPSGQTGRRVTGLIRNTAILSAIGAAATAARALQTDVTAPASDVNSLVLAASISGAGQLNWCGASVGTLSGNLRTVLEVDGIVIFDTTVAASSGNGHIIIGGGDAGTNTAVFQPIAFRSGFRLLLGCSVSGTTLRGHINAEIHA